jgi:membrane protein implicated in regulation of membrane protease activity
MNSYFKKTTLHSITPALFVIAEEFHDIAPPVDYSLIPPWLVFVIAFVVLSLLGLVVWWFAQRRKSELPPKPPREITLEELEQIRAEIERISPYQFSIRVSDILRRYVTQQYGLPATRQTSIEFLTATAKAPSFSADERIVAGRSDPVCERRATCACLIHPAKAGDSAQHDKFI